MTRSMLSSESATFLAYFQPLFAAVELVRFPRLELQGHERLSNRSATLIMPVANEFSDPAVVAVKSLYIDLGKQPQGGAPVPHRAP